MNGVANPHDDRVLIVGGGPVGALAGFLLARAGVPVTVLEAAPERVIDFRASTFHPPTLDLLEDCGATAALVDMGLVAPLMQYRDRNESKIVEFDLAILKSTPDTPPACNANNSS